MFIGWWILEVPDEWEKNVQREFDYHIVTMENAPVVLKLHDKGQAGRMDRVSYIRKFVNGIR